MLIAGEPVPTKNYSKNRQRRIVDVLNANISHEAFGPIYQMRSDRLEGLLQVRNTYNHNESWLAHLRRQEETTKVMSFIETIEGFGNLPARSYAELMEAIIIRVLGSRRKIRAVVSMEAAPLKGQQRTIHRVIGDTGTLRRTKWNDFAYDGLNIHEINYAKSLATHVQITAAQFKSDLELVLPVKVAA